MSGVLLQLRCTRFWQVFAPERCRKKIDKIFKNITRGAKKVCGEVEVNHLLSVRLNMKDHAVLEIQHQSFNFWRVCTIVFASFLVLIYAV